MTHYRFYYTHKERGFTLIETLVAISVLTIAVVAPMTLTSQALSAAMYARDQITAFHLAQEAIEGVRSIRDANILSNAYGSQLDILSGIPIERDFVIDTRDDAAATAIHECTTGTCPPLKTDEIFYAYGPVGTTDIYGAAPGWQSTNFTRTVRASWVACPGEQSCSDENEVRISVTVQWRTSAERTRSFTISQNLYRWVSDVTAQ